jgi:putative tryptophan/tyrosine transport system substrate-binding protein
MPISHLHQPFRRWIIVLPLTMALRQDAANERKSPLIAFVGKVEEKQDHTFARFREALRRNWRGAPPPTVNYYAGGDGRTAILQNALRAASALKPSVLVLPTGELAQEASSLGIAIPIVFATYVDPRFDGIVDSLQRPGRNSTGVSLEDTLDLKRLQLLKDAFPHVRTVAVLADAAWFSIRGPGVMSEPAQHDLRFRLIGRVADSPEAVDALMDSAEAVACDAWYIPPSYIAYQADTRIIAALKRLRLPAMHASENEVMQGALMAYSQDERFTYDALAQLAVRVALGEDAGSIPIQRPYRYTLSVRIEPDAPWARIDPSVVRRADRVHRP